MSYRRISLRIRSFCWIKGKYQTATPSRPAMNNKKTTRRVRWSQMLRLAFIESAELRVWGRSRRWQVMARDDSASAAAYWSCNSSEYVPKTVPAPVNHLRARSEERRVG